MNYSEEELIRLDAMGVLAGMRFKSSSVVKDKYIRTIRYEPGKTLHWVGFSSDLRTHDPTVRLFEPDSLWGCGIIFDLETFLAHFEPCEQVTP